MLLNILSSDMEFGMKLLYLLISIVALLPALTFHEWAHGFTAYKLGDTTAKADGRLSLNPLDHLDPMGSLMMLLVGFGWAKPVPVNTRNLKKPKRDIALVSLAGPLANFVLAFVSALLYVLALYICAKNGISNPSAEALLMIFFYSASFNIGLGLFNLIPLPPLDGSNVVMCALPPKLGMHYSKLRYYSRYIVLGIVLLSWLPYPLNLISDYLFLPLEWARTAVSDAFFTVGELIFAPIFGFRLF